MFKNVIKVLMSNFVLALFGLINSFFPCGNDCRELRLLPTILALCFLCKYMSFRNSIGHVFKLCW